MGQFKSSCRSCVQGFIRPVARVGSGDPVRVLRLYTTNTLDEVCSIYCWDICTTCHYRSTCYSTGASGPTALSVCSWLCLVANCWLSARSLARSLSRSRTVLYGAFYSYLCRRYWNGILGPSMRQGNVFTGVCHSVYRREGVCGWHAPWADTPSTPTAQCMLGYTPPPVATAADGTHPTTMHSCYYCTSMNVCHICVRPCTYSPDLAHKNYVLNVKLASNPMSKIL